MKMCELCRHAATIYCDSDQANLCYDCDQKVHSANFIVAKHSRTLLCRRCQSSTSWTASGLSLGRAASTCANCTHRRKATETRRSGNGVVNEICLYDDVDQDEIHRETLSVSSVVAATPPTVAASFTSSETEIYMTRGDEECSSENISSNGD